PNGTKKSSKLYGIRATALKAIEQWRRGQVVVQDGSVMEAMPTAVNYATKDTLSLRSPTPSLCLAPESGIRSTSCLKISGR
ncbi:hypothetical protein, partial [Nostoc flagelliforme]|uniref:hypothetical protein n=1 Tax=Nostoc flagelliforme TaxID=1306274 RepID=UPI001A7F0D0B